MGITIVLITHEMQVIREICDQVVVIDQGEIVESGQVWSVFSKPEQPITQELLTLEQLDLPFAVNSMVTTETTHTILKLCYESAIHHTPDLKVILEQLNGPVHLYQGHVDTIQQHLIGSLIVAIPDVQLNLKHLKEALKQYIAHIEVLGYARPAH